MDRHRYPSALSTVLRGGAIPYGYTVTLWTSGMMLTRERGIPSVAEVFLFMLGAIAAFASVGVVTRVAHGEPYEPQAESMRRVGMVQFFAVGAALGAATLIALIKSAVVWPLGSFAATAIYLVLSGVELMLIDRG